MDVASLLVVCGCLAQTTGDRYGTYGTAPAVSSPTPAYAAPAMTPYSATPTYPAHDPAFTAAAPKRAANPGPTSPAPTTSAAAPSTTTTPLPARVATPVPSSSLTAVKAPSTTATTEKSAASELVREAIVIPQSLSLQGRSTTLYETLGYAGDRRQRIDAIRGYWKLVAELAEYHFAWQQTQFLEHLQKVTASRSGESQATAAEIAARLASARAQLREDELKLGDAQLELVQRATLAGGELRPLPVDLPHVGIYHTQFDRVFAGRPAPGRAQVLNRTLPLRKEVVAVRADGVWAAQDAYEAAFEAYQKGQLPVEEVLTALDDFRLRRSEFIAAVRRYNEEIAEYAVTSAPEGVTRETLVGMLIKNPSRPAAAAVGSTGDFDGVVPAAYSESSPTFSPTPDPLSAQPAGAAVADVPPLPRNDPPAIPQTSAPARLVVPTNASPIQVPTLAPPRTTVPSATSATGNPLRGEPTPVQQTPTTDGTPVPRYRTNKIPLSQQGPAEGGGGNELQSVDSFPPPPSAFPPRRDSAVVPAGHYTNLVSLPSAQRAQDLVEALYSARTDDHGAATTISLDGCLAGVSTAEHSRVVAAYWNAAEQAARSAAWLKAIELFEALGQATLRMNDSPAKTAAMLRVRSARLAAGAEGIDARAALAAGRAQLTEAVHRSLSEPWLMPETLPHGGGYKTKVEALPASLSKSSPVRQLAGRIDVLHDTLQYRAEAVVQGETAAEAILEQFSRGRTTAHTAVAAIGRQARETDALLATTTRYNLTIAGYALAVLPHGAPRDTLLGALVVNRAAVASRP